MATLNVTYHGISFDYPLDAADKLRDNDIRRIAIELIRSGSVQGIHVRNPGDHEFDNYVVDRFSGPQGERIYLRPKVPFGSHG